jgi:hypothetical protein
MAHAKQIGNTVTVVVILVMVRIRKLTAQVKLQPCWTLQSSRHPLCTANTALENACLQLIENVPARLTSLRDASLFLASSAPNIC